MSEEWDDNDGEHYSDKIERLLEEFNEEGEADGLPNLDNFFYEEEEE